MKNPFDDDRFRFVFTLAIAVSFLWFSSLTSPLFWFGVVSWVLIFFLARRVMRRILKADSWAKAIESGTFNRKVAIRFYPVLVAMLYSPLLLLFLATRINVLEPLLFSGMIGLLVGLDCSIGYKWVRRRRK